ncbi:hypothetical protein GJ496_011542 [Pomphorhynchus laevis]|nr:hypothetical protein GJ496_011542 [Pomphorhynchus laevis]
MCSLDDSLSTCEQDSEYSASSPCKKARMSFNAIEKVLWNMGKWTALDDYKLITSFLHCRNPSMILAFSSFCNNRTIADIKDRWQCILRDRTFCRFVIDRINALPISMLASAISSIPFNTVEQEALSQIDVSHLITIL